MLSQRYDRCDGVPLQRLPKWPESELHG